MLATLLMPEKLSPWNKNWAKIIQYEENLFKELSTPCINSSAFCVNGRRSEVTYLLLHFAQMLCFSMRDAISNLGIQRYAQFSHIARHLAFLALPLCARNTPQSL